jgi:soluble lytic murein transglycosylase-like protein
MRLFALFSGALLLLLAFAGVAEAQITVVVDENGRRVYVNDFASKPLRATATPSQNGSGTASKGQTSGLSGSSNRRVVSSREEIEQIVREAAQRHHVDPALVRAVIKAESAWNPAAVSRAGAQGLMQLMPATAEQHGVDNAFDPAQNVNAGVKHLRMLLEKYNGDLDLALAAYNAGEGAVRRAGGVPNIAETRAYVQKVTETYFRPGSERATRALQTSRPIYRTVDAKGRVIYTNE